MVLYGVLLEYAVNDAVMVVGMRLSDSSIKSWVYRLLLKIFLLTLHQNSGGLKSHLLLGVRYTQLVSISIIKKQYE